MDHEHVIIIQNFLCHCIKSYGHIHDVCPAWVFMFEFCHILQFVIYSYTRNQHYKNRWLWRKAGMIMQCRDEMPVPYYLWINWIICFPEHAYYTSFETYCTPVCCSMSAWQIHSSKLSICIIDHMFVCSHEVWDLSHHGADGLTWALTVLGEMEYRKIHLQRILVTSSPGSYVCG